MFLIYNEYHYHTYPLLNLSSLSAALRYLSASCFLLFYLCFYLYWSVFSRASLVIPQMAGFSSFWTFILVWLSKKLLTSRALSYFTYFCLLFL